MKDDIEAPANDTIPHEFKAHWKSGQERNKLDILSHIYCAISGTIRELSKVAVATDGMATVGAVSSRPLSYGLLLDIVQKSRVVGREKI